MDPAQIPPFPADVLVPPGCLLVDIYKSGGGAVRYAVAYGAAEMEFKSSTRLKQWAHHMVYTFMEVVKSTMVAHQTKFWLCWPNDQMETHVTAEYDIPLPLVVFTGLIQARIYLEDNGGGVREFTDDEWMHISDPTRTRRVIFLPGDRRVPLVLN